MRWSARKNRFSIKTAQCERQFCREIKRAKAFLNCHASRADIYVNTHRDRSVRVLHSLFSIHCLARSIQQYMNALFTSRGLADPNVESVNATCVLISTRLSARPKAHGPLKTFCSVCYALSLHDGTFESLPSPDRCAKHKTQTSAIDKSPAIWIVMEGRAEFMILSDDLVFFRMPTQRQLRCYKIPPRMIDAITERLLIVHSDYLLAKDASAKNEIIRV